ncbi:MerR family transcriptional regulator [Lacticaseibacillus suibinensis]|uniref:MerR family transcriptional regulator n=1 Tax=Lacticaseibacillus suibinensis TaxID=2486011 RepID=UPI000F7A8280|nr:MerR family transcriptional regulator [Lacticaseibacillus suibinensis]
MDNEVTYSIGEVAARLGLTVQAIRYYDAEGLLPLLKRDSGGRRVFYEDDVRTLQMILDLRDAGVSIKDSATFEGWRLAGDQTLQARADFLTAHERELQDRIDSLKASMAHLHFKQWYYQTALAAGTERIHLVGDSMEISQQTFEQYERLQRD